MPLTDWVRTGDYQLRHGDDPYLTIEVRGDADTVIYTGYEQRWGNLRKILRSRSLKTVVRAADKLYQLRWNRYRAAYDGRGELNLPAHVRQLFDKHLSETTP